MNAAFFRSSYGQLPGERAVRRPARHGLAEPAPRRPPPGGSPRRSAAPAVRPPRAAL